MDMPHSNTCIIPSMASLWSIAPTIAAWTLGVLGLLLILSGFFRDHARGRKRCPRCWYDMSGATSLQCPECGRSARSARQLTRTRRRWRSIVVGVLIASLSSTLIFGSLRLKHEGATAFIPSTVLIALARYADATGGTSPTYRMPTTFTDTGLSSSSAELLVNRYRRGESFAWQRKITWHAAHARMNADLDLDPPAARAVMLALLTESDRTIDPMRDPRCADLVTVALSGPLVGVVGFPLCVHVDAYGFRGDAHVVVLEADNTTGPSSPVVAYTDQGKLNVVITSSASVDPMLAMADLGSPHSVGPEVWVTARIWRKQWGQADEVTIASRPPDTVRRVRLAIAVVPPEWHTLTPVTLDPTPFVGGSRAAFARSWSFEGDPLGRGQCSIILPQLRTDVPSDVAVGFRVEVLRNAKVFCSGRACLSQTIAGISYPWGTSSLRLFLGGTTSTALLTFADDVDEIAPRFHPPAVIPNAPAQPDTWLLRIVSDETMACWQPLATRYWVGEIFIPLTDVPNFERRNPPAELIPIERK